MTYPLFGRWLLHTRNVQEQVYGYDFDSMNTPAKAMYLQKMTFAAMVELGEVSREFSWKPWATDKPYINRDRVIAELVDVMHFVGDCFAALGVTDEELNMEYSRKLDENIARARSGKYKAVKP